MQNEPPMPLFHSRDGLHFGRLPDGGVLIWLKTDNKPNGAGPRVVLDKHSWASVMAFLTPKGDNAETWRDALAFHETGRCAHNVITRGPDPGVPLPDPWDEDETPS